MDSFPQELIDEIIDNIPQTDPLSRCDLSSCSLVAKRWRRRSQQRFFEGISPSSEDDLNVWWSIIPQDPDGIPSYVLLLKIEGVVTWDDPLLLGRVLKNLTSLQQLLIFETRIPDELQDPVLRGEFGKEITTLCLWTSYCALATTMSIILSLPKLEDLVIGNHNTSGEPLSTHLITPQRRSLDSLRLGGDIDEVGEPLAESRLIYRILYLDTHLPITEQLITLSSENLVQLGFGDTSVENDIFPPIHLPSLPALATLGVELCEDYPSLRLTDILCSILSAPALTSITVGSDKWDVNEYPPSASWVGVDRWLAQIVKHAEVKGGVPLTLRKWPEGKSVWEGFLPEFRKAGGEIKTDTGDW